MDFRNLLSSLVQNQPQEKPDGNFCQYPDVITTQNFTYQDQPKQEPSQNGFSSSALTTLLPIISMFNGGKGNVASLLSNNLPENMKQFEPLISMFTNKKDKAEIKSDLPDIDTLKRIE